MAVATAAPFVIRFAYGYLNGFVLLLAWTLTLPSVALLLLTLRQEGQRRPQASVFSPSGLAAASIVLAVSAFFLALLGLVGAVLAFVLVPVGVVTLVFAWVQPRDSTPDVAATATLGIALLAFGVWFVGRADEYVNEALVAGLGLLGVVAGLVALRRRSDAVGCYRRT